MSDTVENWKWIPDHEGRYAVSDKGRVYSYVRNQYLQPKQWDSTGHVAVSLGRKETRDVQDLVLAAFVGPRPEGKEALHGNGVPDDNRLDNLEWGTRSQNVMDLKWHGSRKGALNVLQIMDIKLALLDGATQTQIAKDFGINQGTVSRIALGKQHADVF